MIFTTESATSSIEELLMSYPHLELMEPEENSIRLHGTILVHRSVQDFTLRKEYLLDIIIPINSDKLPFVIDADRVIDPTYHHYYSNSGKLCLETDTAIHIRFLNGFNLLQWMDEFVEPYFVNYEYYRKYGTFPLGERSHSCIGVLETYQEMFHVQDIHTAFCIMSHVKNNNYDGHQLCPCGSKRFIRKCHSKWILPFYNNPHLNALLLSDLDAIIEEIKTYDTERDSN